MTGRKFLRVFLVFAAAALGAVACNSSNNSPPAPPACAPPNGTTTVLVYPAPGSTGIPDNFGQVILGSTAAGLSNTYQAFVFDSSSGVNGYYFATVTPAPSPLPSPAATPTFLNPVYQSSSSTNPNLWPQGHTLSVYLNDQANSSCTPQTSLGSFTVQ
jgi:hypothetical protein